MKFSLILFSIFFVAMSQAETNQFREVSVNITNAYIPGGFDSESDAFVVVNGLFPNGCYSWSRSEVKRDGNTHQVNSFAHVSSGMCIQVLVPFTEEVQLGQLESGTHTVVFNNGDGTSHTRQIVIE